MLDVFRGSMSLRRLGVLLRGLPPESAAKTSMRDSMSDEEYEAWRNQKPGKAFGRWSLTDALIARVGDLLQMQMYQASDRKGEMPKPLTRPGMPREAEVIPINEKAIAFLMRTRELRGGVPDREEVSDG